MLRANSFFTITSLGKQAPLPSHAAILCVLQLLAFCASLTAQTIYLPSTRVNATGTDTNAFVDSEILYFNKTISGTDDDSDSDTQQASASVNWNLGNGTGIGYAWTSVVGKSYTYGNPANTVGSSSSIVGYNRATYVSASTETSVYASGDAIGQFQVNTNPSHPSYGQSANSSTLSCNIYFSTQQSDLNNRTVSVANTSMSFSLADSTLTTYPLDDNCEYWQIDGTLGRTWDDDPTADPELVDEIQPGNNYVGYYASKATQVGATFTLATSIEYESTVEGLEGPSNGIELFSFFPYAEYVIYAGF
jgi:hypothetical protein